MSSSGLPVDAREIYRRYVSAVVLHGQVSAAAVGLGATDLYAVNLLHLAGSMTSGELAARTGLTTGATTRLIDRLERAGYLRRRHDPDDRRRIFVEGIDRSAEVDPVVEPARRHLGAVIATYDEEQQALLFDYFARAVDAYLSAINEIARPAAGASGAPD